MKWEFTPELISVIREGMSLKQIFADIQAGLIVGIVALPISVAFAIASGVKPEQGLYTAIIAGFIISLLSGSRVQIGGPTGAFIVLVSSVVTQFGVSGLTVITVMAGILLLIMGFTRMGSIIKYIPYPVTIGFTTGIGFIIFMTQIKDFLGIKGAAVPVKFVEQILYYSGNLSGINYWSLGIALGSILIIQYWPRITKKIPGSLIAILAATIAAQMLDLPVETIGSRFGEISNSFQAPRMPEFSWSMMAQMFPSALGIALLAGIESLLSAVVADGMTGERHNSNMELVAQGVANVIAPFFGGIPATGAIARTATNIKNGGQTPISGIVHAMVLLAILFLFGKLAALIPMASLAGVLMIVAYNMAELRIFKKIMKAPKSDIFVLLTVFLLTVFFDLVLAIEVGVVLASLLFMRRMSGALQISNISQSLDGMEESGGSSQDDTKYQDVPEGTEVFEIYGPFFFGAADVFKSALTTVAGSPRVLVLRMRHVPFVDATALKALEDVLEKSRREDIGLVLSGVQPAVMAALEKTGFLKNIGENNVHTHIAGALKRAGEIIAINN